MSKGTVNKAIIVGNVGKEPEIRYTANGMTVATISIATSESWKDKQSGENHERTEWHRVIFFNKLADIVGQYVQKGTKVYIEGSLKTTKWQDKVTGQDRYRTDIHATSMQMISNKHDHDETNHSNSNPNETSYNLTGTSDFDDDIPF